MVEQQFSRKFRPTNFSQIVGQESQKKNLMNHIKQNACPQAILFSGPAGVGKTTIARIVAKRLNCKNPTETSEPCNECDSCKDVQSEAFNRNIYMVDAGSNRGVTQIEPLKQDINTYPLYGDKYKIFIFDEAHMLTATVFNSFLTTIEEPPEYIFFFFCTTEPLKVLKTIRSRCLQVKLNPLKDQEVACGLAQALSTHYKRQLTRVELFVIKKAADVAFGCLRDALIVLQTLVYNDALTLEKCDEFIPRFDETTFAKCVEWVFTKNPLLLEYIDSLDETKDFDAFFLQMRKIIKTAVLAKLNVPLDGPDWLVRAAKMNANRVAPEDLQFLVETFNIDTTRLLVPKEHFFSKFSSYFLNV